MLLKVLQSLSWYHWLLIGIICSSILVLIIIQIILFLLNHQRKIEGQIIDDIETIKLLPLRQRLYRLSEIAIYNDEYAQLLPGWIQNFENHIEKILGLINQQQENYNQTAQNWFFKNFMQQKQLLKKIKELEIQARNLLNSYEDVIRMEITQRQQATLYKSAFNFLVNDVTKLQIHDQFNDSQLDFLINTLQNMLYNFEIQITKGAFLKSYQLLDQIGIGLITFSNILEKLPQLLTVIHRIIPKQIEQMKITYCEENQDLKIRDQFIVIHDNMETLILQTKELINNLQYKKAQQIIEKILNDLTSFNYQIKRQQDFQEIFNIYYEPTIKVVQSLEQGFKKLKLEFQQLEKTYAFSPLEKEIVHSTEQLVLALGLQTNSLVVLVNKTKGELNYHIFVKMQYELLEDALKAQNSLEQFHKLLGKKNEEEKQLQQLLSHLGILLMQLNTKLNQITYHKIATVFKEQVSLVYNSFLDLKESISMSDNLNEQKHLLHRLYLLKDDIYKLHSKIKNIVIIDQLIQKAIIYGYKFCELDANVNNKIKSAQLVYENANYEDALQLVLQALEYSNDNRLYRLIGKQ